MYAVEPVTSVVSICLPIHLYIHPSFYFVYLLTYLSICLSIYLCT